MTAWPMIETCLRQQWRGYSTDEREAVLREWAALGTWGCPGIVGSLGHRQYPIWLVEHEEREPQAGDLLITIKIDSHDVPF